MEDKIKKVICKRCGADTSYVKYLDNLEYGECTNCGEFTYYIRQEPTIEELARREPIVRCPYCQSVCTRKISKVSKIGNVAMWGVFALGKVSKEWHCESCNSDF